METLREILGGSLYVLAIVAAWAVIVVLATFIITIVKGKK